VPAPGRRSREGQTYSKSVSNDPPTDQARDQGARLRRRRVAAAGHRGDEVLARRGLEDPDAAVQVAAVGALQRMGRLEVSLVVRALAGDHPAVRRRAVDAAPAVSGKGSRSVLPTALTQALSYTDPLVVVGAAWFLGERRYRPAVAALAQVVQAHGDTRCREAAVAALGAIGDPAGLPAVLGALEDKPTVRRRATVALAGFDDPAVEPALRRAAVDRDWQVRQAADELLDEPASAAPGPTAPGDTGPA
jgi:HEAT repeat protein